MKRYLDTLKNLLPIWFFKLDFDSDLQSEKFRIQNLILDHKKTDASEDIKKIVKDIMLFPKINPFRRKKKIKNSVHI